MSNETKRDVLKIAMKYAAKSGWLDYDDMINRYDAALPDDLPVIPKAVGDELEIAKKSRFSFDGYITRVIDGHPGYTNSCAFWNSSDNSATKTLMDAWYNGYTVEKGPVSLVYVPGTNKEFIYCKRGKWSKQGANSETPVTPQTIATWSACKDKNESLFEFTDAEITKFGLQDCEKEEVTDDGTK